jgi:signal transduction histidine kinase
VELSLATWEVQGAKYFSAIIRDVSERQRAQDELEAALARERDVAIRLQELDRLRNTLLDVVSHDLRSPLAAIRSIAAVLQRDAATHNLSDEQRQSSLSGLEVSALKMRNLLDDLLDLERLAAGDTSLQRRMVDLAELTRSVVAQNAAMLASRDVRQDLEPVIAAVDPPKVERIVENLLVNASRHTPDGTPVCVSVRRRAGSALICVDDSGPGVPADQRQVVFERFHQVAGSSRAGVGMGLSLVARLTELHGGRAWVEASTTGGASFRVRLPISSPTHVA